MALKHALAVMDRFLAEFADARCAHCGFPVMDGSLCGHCAELSLPAGHRCHRCDGAVAAPLPRCGRCLKGFLRGLESFRAASLYAGPFRTLVVRGKLSNRRSWIEATAPLVAAAASRGAVRVEAFVPVPASRPRFAERGFNAAEIMAHLLAANREPAPVVPLLERVRAHAPLSAGASRAARQRAVRGAFQPRVGITMPKTVCLVDDVLTTGATLSACALALRRAGVREVHGWTLLRAADPIAPEAAR